MEFIQSIVSSISWGLIVKTGFRILMILCMAWIATKLILKSLQRLEKQLVKKVQVSGDNSQDDLPDENQKRIETIVRLIKQGGLLGLWLTVGLMVIQDLGVEIAPIIASAGVVGLAVGFGAQNLVRDVIAGLFIILENQIRVGDWANINGTEGLVAEINFRTTVLRDLSGVVHVFPNGTITTLSNMTNEWSAYVFEIGVAYKENTDHVVSVMKEVGHQMIQVAPFSKYMLAEPEILGVDKFADSAVVIKGRLKTKPIRQWEVGREFLRRVKLAFDEKNIEIPFPHRSLYFGEASQGFQVNLTDQLFQNEEKSS